MVRVIAGGVDVVTAGTRVAFASARTAAAVVVVQAKSGNVGDVFVGDNTVSSVNIGARLGARDSVTFPAVADINGYDLTTLFVDAVNDGDGVSVMFFRR